MNNCIFFIVIFASAVYGKADPYRGLGSSFVLCSDYVAPPLTSITWKHGKDIAVDWFKGTNVTSYRIFEGYSSLNTTSGCLTLLNVTLKNSGRYTPEINDKVKDPIEIKIISPVPKPTVSSACNHENTHCNLTCEGITTDDHGPVEFSWILGDMYLSGDKTLQITQENHENRIGCVLENPVSRKGSEHISNPLTGIRNHIIILIVMAILLLVVVVALVSYCICKKKQERQTYRVPEQSRQELCEFHNNHNNEFKELDPLLSTSTPNGTTVNSPEKNIKPDELTGEGLELEEVVEVAEVAEVAVPNDNKRPDEPTGEEQELVEVAVPDDNKDSDKPADAEQTGVTSHDDDKKGPDEPADSGQEPAVPPPNDNNKGPQPEPAKEEEEDAAEMDQS